MDADDRDVVVVSDTSVLIDLERGSLLEAAFRLPFACRLPKGRVGERLRLFAAHAAQRAGRNGSRVVSPDRP